VGFNHGFEEETTLAERWNGIEWQALNTVELGGAQPTNRLEAVSCNTPSACMAVGSHLSKIGSQFLWAPLAERWNGSAWSLQAIPEPPASEEASLSGVSCASANSCTAVGSYRQISGSDSYAEVLGERWNGTSWSVLEMPGPAQPPGWWHETWLFAASCPQAEACTSVGAGLSAPPGGLSPYRALAEQETAALLATFSSTPSSPIATQPIQFEGSASSPNGHAIESYEWDFGDGSQGSGASTSHAYAHAGDYTVTLKVTDDEADSTEISRAISIAPAPPRAAFEASAVGAAGTRTLAFDSSASSDPDGTIKQWSWDFGDGTHGKGPNPLHTYAQVGDYTATLTVTDDAGLEDSVSKSVAVTPPPDPKGGENPNPGTPPATPAPRAPASFDLRGIAIDCNGQIVLSLLASQPGRFDATATATVPGHRTPGRQRAGRPGSSCPSDRPTPVRRPSFLARAATHFAYGAASVPTQGARTTRLTIAPSARAEREAARRGSLRIAISISLSTLIGEKPHKRTSLLYRR
jgi:PKD repeat protein